MPQARPRRREIGKGAQVHLDVSAQSEIAACLAAIGKKVVVPEDVSSLRQQTNGLCQGDRAVGEAQCVVGPGRHTVHPDAHRGLRKLHVVEPAL